MVVLNKTGKRLAKGNHVVVIGKDQTHDEKISEVWINAGGSFDTAPLLASVGTPAFRLPSSGRQTLLDESYRLWKFDALGGTIVRTTTYFTLSRGVVFQFDNEKAQFYAKKFYRKNKLEIRMRSASDEGTAFGEVFIWLRPHFTEVRKGSRVIWRPGDVQITFIPPDNISNIETADEDVGDVRNYTYEYETGGREWVIEKIPDITKYDFEGDGRSRGCILHVKFNAGNMDPFGHSDLIPVKEWLDNYQEYLRDGVVINKLYRSPCYDVSIADGSPEEVNAAISRYRGWAIGSNPVHNDRETWQILEFKGPSSSNEEARRALLLIIAAGVGFAEYMLADAGNSNLATAKSQQLPVIKKFEDRQDVWAYHLMELFQFALRAKATINRTSGLEIKRDEEGDFEPFAGRVEFPSISRADDLEIAQTNTQALAQGYMSPRTAATRLNIDYDRELEQVENDLPRLKSLRDKLDQSEVNIPIGGPLPFVTEAEMPGQGSGGPNSASKNANGSRGGKPDQRNRNRDRQPGGSRESLKT